MKQTIITLVVLVILAAGGWYLYSTGALKGIGTPSNMATSTAPAIDVTQPVAMVNGQTITRGQLNTAEAQVASQAGVNVASLDASTTKQLETQALASLVNQALLAQAAAAGGFTASSTAVDAQIAQLKTQLGGDAAYQQALGKQGLTEDALRTQVAQGLAINAYLEATLHLSKVTATSAEITSAYNQIKAAQQGTTTPPLSQVKAQVEQLVIQQKQQQLAAQEVQKLRAAASIQTLI
jgi:hypothetical protein